MSKGTNIVKRIIVFVCLFLLLTTTVLAGKSYKDQLDGMEDDLISTEREIEQTEKEVDTINSNIAELNVYITDLDKKIENYEKYIQDLNQKINNKELDIEKKLEELDASKKDEFDYYEKTKERMKIMYEYGETGYLEILLESKNLTDFFNRIDYINDLMEYDSNMLIKLEEIKETIIAQEEQLQNEKSELEDLVAETNVSKSAMEEVRVAKADEIVTLLDNKEIKLMEIQQRKEEMQAIEASIETLKSNMPYDGGKMEWPVTGYSRISSYFGWRTHPVHGARSFHQGIDIPAPTGTKIKAAYTGRVLFAGYGTAYGNYILVDHGVYQGKSYITMYAHCSKILVKEGEKVTIGQTIAKIGSTGWSTGPHLHFGIRVDSDWINPLNKLDR